MRRFFNVMVFMYYFAIKNHFMKTLGLMLTGSVTTLGLLSYFGAWQPGDRLVKALQSVVANPQPAAQADVQSLVIQQVRDASELTTALYSLQAVVPTRRDATLAGVVLGTTRLLYIAQGEVRAGVDLSQLSPQAIQIEGDRVQVQLPSPHILSQSIDVNRSRVYDYNRGFLNLGPDVAPELQSLAQQEALQQVVQAACRDGVLERASDRARLVVTQLLRGAGYTTITVTFPAVAPDACGLPPKDSSGQNHQKAGEREGVTGSPWLQTWGRKEPPHK